MTPETRRRILLVVGAVLVLAAVVYGFVPDPVPVRTAAVERGPLREVVEEEGETRVADRYVISSPVPAYARRIEVEEGQPVTRGQPVVQLEAPRPAILDPRNRAEAASRVEEARARVAQAEAAAEQARVERARMERLAEGGASPRQAAERAAADEVRARADLAAARAERSAAGTALRGVGGDAAAGPVREVLRAPADGVVLAVHHESGGAVTPGEPLVEVGNTRRLEVRVDVLSEDAVRIRPGTPVVVDQWGGDAPLHAVVERVDPEAFTRVSSLGVEEKRVPVTAALTSPPGAWRALGAGYRVLARFVTWEGRDVLQVPTSALFRSGNGWAAFVVEDGRAALRTVEVGHESGLAAEVLSGLRPGERVIVHPANEIAAGTRVEPE